MKFPNSSKHMQINKAQSTVLIILTIGVVVTVFSLVSSKTLLSRASYQRKVLHSRREGLKTLQEDLTNSSQLVNQYQQVFEGNDPSNIIGGKNTTDPNAQPPDGDNARIVLDALPSSYDFPALITSVTKILTLDGIGGAAVSSSDQTATVNNKPSATPQPTSIQLTVTGSGSYAQIQNLIHDFERSVRPFDITNVQMSSSGSQISVSLTMNTYYQPAKVFEVGSKVVK